ncbi:hypothetical protein ACM46_13690 [Chryseobacterium angstadtii]|uniref:Peptidase S74 domain-containing protein n=1 Tax=Chryseobacterium angstadtii TaxID=558151 RepID=A0A0J7I9B7_9FLAO|nr:hypothetical protein [Chryseobacterium angstadtii]KMQ62998.1 hypothetical protein ACM46_13690 [Chryseobacterium angstadtii]
MSIPLNIIYSYFETGDFPTQEQFQASWSSFWHKDDSIPAEKITNLNYTLQNKVDKSVYELHLSDPQAHTAFLAKRDASNLSATDKGAWKSALEIEGIPANIATVDDGVNVGNVHSKSQAVNLFMMNDEFLNAEGKITADKLEALALTRIFKVKEHTLQDFMNNAGAYEYEESDIIAIPSSDAEPKYSLYFYLGNEKNSADNYLNTGVSNVSMSMVEGLEEALRNKLDRPSRDGKYYLRQDRGLTLWSPLPEPNLADVVNRDFYSPKPITFLDGEERPNAMLGMNPTSYSYFFGNMNPAHTGTYNHSFGYNSLSKVTTGECNAAFGSFAGSELTVGECNTFLGAYAGRKAVSGNYNVMVGEETGHETTTGFKNTMVGTAAGYNSTTGALNTLIGHKAGNTTGLGDRNTILGAHSGQGVTGNNNILVGVGAGTNDGAISNKLIIHSNNTLVKYTNTDEGTFGSFQQGALSLALITGDFVERWVKFNGTFSINPARIPVGDSSFNKTFVGNANGQFGWIDRVDSIPLSGTKPGSPLTGNIEMSTEEGCKLYSGSANVRIVDGYIDMSSEASNVLINPMQVAITSGGWNSLKYINMSTELNFIAIKSNHDGPGLVGTDYYGENYIDRSFVQKRWVEEKIKEQVRPYKLYRAILRFTDKDFMPRFIVLENTIGDIEWARKSTGEYTGYLKEAFNENVWINSKINYFDGKEPIDCRASRTDGDTVTLNIYRMYEFRPADLAGEVGIIEIRIYPVTEK